MKGIKTALLVFASLFLLALAATVPTGKILPLVQNAYYIGEEPGAPLSFQAYGGMAAAGLALFGAIVSLRAAKKSRDKGKAMAKGLRYFVLAGCLGFVCARLLYCLVCIDFYTGIAPLNAVLKWWEGGMSMTGALVGAAAAALIVWKDEPAGYEGAALGLPVFVLPARLGEKHAGTGYGMDVEFEGLFALPGAFGGVLNVWIMEAAAAALILLALLLWRKDRLCPRGKRYLMAFFICYGAVQILMESLRADRHMIWGFVKAQQLFSFLLAGGCLAAFAWRCGRRIAALAASVLLAAGVFGLEKALDRLSIPALWLYLAFAALILGYLAFCAKVIRRDEKRLRGEKA